MALLPLGLFVALIAANFFSQYLSGKEVVIYVLVFVAGLFLPRPLPTVVAVILDVVLFIKFKMEHF